MSIYKYLIAVCITIAATFSLQAQTEELPSADSSVVVKKKTKKNKVKKQRDYSKLDPKKATLFSTVLPGLGQAYNKRYWKIPIIYGLGAWTIHTAVQCHGEYKTALCNVDSLSDNDDINTLPDDKGYELTEDQWRTIKSEAKRTRDVNIIYAVAIYGLQIVDAAVDAHLLRFHNSDKFLAEFEPTFIQHRGHTVTALSLNFRLK